MSHARLDRRLASLRRRLEQRRRLRDLEVAIPGAARPFRLAAPADPDAVLDEVAASFATTAPHGLPSPALASEDDLGAEDAEPHMPYWATPWASGLALAEVALAGGARLAGRRTLELGCGLGATAAAALAVGARLAAADCFPETLTFCRYNSLRNSGREPLTLLADWRTRAGHRRLVDAGSFDIVLAADVLYEPEDVAPLLSLIPRLLAPSGVFWLAEPGRATSRRFVAEAAAAGWRSDRVDFERDWPAGVGHAAVTVHRYTHLPWREHDR